MSRQPSRYLLAVVRRSLRLSQRHLRFDPVSRRVLPSRSGWHKLGSSSCGWLAPKDWKVGNPVCICVGAGEDISFDLALSERFEARVIILDPTPRAIAHVQNELRCRDDVVFRPWAVWSSDQTVQLFEPVDPAHVSHSIVNLQGTGKSFSAEARTIGSIMDYFDVDRIDLLKLDIEGAEYEVIDNILGNSSSVGILNVEFDELQVPKPGAWKRVRACVDLLCDHGFVLIAVDMTSNYTFVRADYADSVIPAAH